MTDTVAWQAAQVSELRYWDRWYDPALTREWHRGIAGLMQLDAREIADRSVIDVGCGPVSLMFDYPPARGVGLDPLDFGPEREAAYATRGLARLLVPAEEIAEDLWRLDEAWCYNCLQHVISPGAVLLTMTRLARGTIRIFEWIHEPVSEVHLHVLDPDLIANHLRAGGWHPASEMTGTWRARGITDLQFYAGLWRLA